MANVGNKWSLFGLDLTRSGKWLALGFHQLMYDHGAWLLQRFDPSIRVIRGGEALWYRADAPLGGNCCRRTDTLQRGRTLRRRRIVKNASSSCLCGGGFE